MRRGACHEPRGPLRDILERDDSGEAIVEQLACGHEVTTATNDGARRRAMLRAKRRRCTVCPVVLRSSR